LKLYNSDLSVYDYANADNLIIIANSPTKGDTVVLLYGNELRKTVYKDFYLNEAYTITHVLQIWIPQTIDGIINKYFNMDDSLVENGQLLFTNWDNEAYT
jgi:hypothetical protein